MRTLSLLFFVVLALPFQSSAASKAAATCQPKGSCKTDIDSANLNCQHPDQTDDTNEAAWRTKIQTDDTSLAALAQQTRPSSHDIAVLTQDRNQNAGGLATTKGKKCLDAIDNCHQACPASCTSTCDRDNQQAYGSMISDGYAAQVAANRAAKTAAASGD